MKPKIHSILETGTFRPVMGFALLSREHLVASDAHVLVAHSTPEIFKAEFVESIPENDVHKEWLVGKTCLRHMTKKGVTYKIKGTDIIIHDGDEIIKYEMFPNGYIYSYPDWKSVISDEKKTFKVNSLRFNVRLLRNLQMAIDPFAYGIELFSTGNPDNDTANGKALIAKVLRSDIKNYKAIIMPVVV